MYRPCALALILVALTAASQTPQPDPHSIPAIDAGIGSCTADFTIADPANKPIYNAKINVHIAYGTLSVRKLDLEVATNVDGKARFTGLPSKLKRNLYFEATSSNLQAEAVDDVNKTCTAQFTLQLLKKP